MVLRLDRLADVWWTTREIRMSVSPTSAASAATSISLTSATTSASGYGARVDGVIEAIGRQACGCVKPA